MKWKDYYRYDFVRMTGCEYSNIPKRIVFTAAYYHLRFTKHLRKYQSKHSFIQRAILLHYSHKYGLEISCNAKIGKGLYLGHPHNITVSGNATLGDNVCLMKGCTIGRENRGKRIGAPNIGNNVYIGINATVVGNINIGNDVLIAPNTYVNFDVPDHSIVIGGTKATIHHNDEATKNYVNFVSE